MLLYFYFSFIQEGISEAPAMFLGRVKVQGKVTLQIVIIIASK